MAYDHQLFESIRKRAWMVGLPERVKNVIAAYGCEKINFTRNMLVNDLIKGDFQLRAVNAGPKTVDIIVKHLGINITCLTKKQLRALQSFPTARRTSYRARTATTMSSG